MIDFVLANLPVNLSYSQKLKLNLKLAYVKSLLGSMMFFLPIWYEFESRFASPAALSTAYAVSHLLIVFLELPTGALADLLGRRKTVILGNLLIGAGWLYMSQIQSMQGLFIAYGFNAAGSALASGANEALYYDSLKELDREEDFAKFQTQTAFVFRIGMIIGSFAGGWLFRMGVGLPYVVTGLLQIASGLVTFIITEPKIDTEKFSLKNYLLQTKLGIKQLTKNSYIKDFSWYYLAVGAISWYFVYFLGQVYITEQGFNAAARSYLYAVIYILVAAINWLLVTKIDMPRKFVYMLFPAAMIIGFLPGALLPKYLSVITLFLGTMVGNFRFAILNQYTNIEFESKFRATAVSALNMGVSLAYSLMSIVLAPVVNSFGSGVVMSILGVLTIVFVLPPLRVLLTTHRNSR